MHSNVVLFTIITCPVLSKLGTHITLVSPSHASKNSFWFPQTSKFGISFIINGSSASKGRLARWSGAVGAKFRQRIHSFRAFVGVLSLKNCTALSIFCPDVETIRVKPCLNSYGFGQNSTDLHSFAYGKRPRRSGRCGRLRLTGSVSPGIMSKRVPFWPIVVNISSSSKRAVSKFAAHVKLLPRITIRASDVYKLADCAPRVPDRN